VRTYIAIDLKSFYASVECVERGLDPLDTNLVVADPSRTEKTICLAVSPTLKAYGISGRARLFEVVQRLREVNFRRRQAAGGRLNGKSVSDSELKNRLDCEVDYIAAVPRMAFYIEYSTRIYNIYLRYIAPEDIHVYSIDEVFIDATHYLDTYKTDAHTLAMTLIHDVLKQTGITATAGIGSNMYLCKIAMDIEAKHKAPDADGVRIAELDEMSYRRLLWNHRPLTDFWRVGRGIAQRLEQIGVTTMGELARRSLENEEQLYQLFGVNAELLIDHAWGWEPCTIDMVKAYRPATNSFSSGQVLQSPYSFDKARTVVMEMADSVALMLTERGMVTDQLVLSVGYDTSDSSHYSGPLVSDHYGRTVPKPAHGTANLPRRSASSKLITQSVLGLYDRIVDRQLKVRRINIATNNVVEGEEHASSDAGGQLDLFADVEENARRRQAEEEAIDKEHRMQEALVDIKKKFGKNAILKGMNFEEGATAKERNKQIGGHRE